MNIWLHSARPKTLPAAVIPVMLGSALAAHDGVFQLFPAFVCLTFALLIQIATNFANDYCDFIKGADTAERIGPKRAVASGEISAGTMRRATVVTFALAFAVGLLLVPYGGIGLILIGVLSVLCGYAYTGGPYPLGYNGLGDVFVFIFFGLVAVMATYFVQAGSLTWQSFAVACVPGLLSVNLLIVNNYRDYETDRKTGKRTLIVRFGRGFGRTQHFLSHTVCLLVPLILWASGMRFWVLLSLLLTPLAYRIHRNLLQADTGAEYIGVLGQTALYLMLFATFFSVGLLLA
ncbi:MAG: 1,4-dihydroxy-2-naphthoate polyprenyltransferase [Opitutales bacterium]|nr:1,4-dihydroxy-2-naphthoate polyprenyltransferase [Opitutales bacterium]